MKTVRQLLKLADTQLRNAGQNIWEAKQQWTAENPDVRWTMDDQIVAGLYIQAIRSMTSFMQFGRPYALQFTATIKELIAAREKLDKKFPSSGSWPSITQQEKGP